MASKNLKKILLSASIVLVCGACNGSENNKSASVNNNTDTPEAAAKLVGPIDREGAYVLEMTDGTDTVLFECAANEGGLITKFALNGKHMVSQLKADNQYGSTFWPSPQNWGWPPARSMPNLTAKPYTVTVEADSNTIVLESQVEQETGFQFIKRFSADLENMAVNIRYTIRNTSDDKVSVAPWEITRVLPGGVTFFPIGEKVYKNNLAIEETTGMIWYLQPTSGGGSGDSKLFADGKDGWVAHATSEMVFIKTFDDLPPSVRAPNQGEIEVYANGSTYQEIEQHGAYKTIPAGGEIHWDLTWFLRPMPADAKAVIGNQQLVDFAASFASR